MPILISGEYVKPPTIEELDDVISEPLIPVPMELERKVIFRDNVIVGSADLEQDIVIEPEKPIMLSPFISLESIKEQALKQQVVTKLTVPIATPIEYKEALISGEMDLLAYEMAKDMSKTTFVGDEFDPILQAELYEEYTGKELTEAEEWRLWWIRLKAKLLLIWSSIKIWSIPITIVSIIVIGLIGYQYSKGYITAKAVKRAGK